MNLCGRPGNKAPARNNLSGEHRCPDVRVTFDFRSSAAAIALAAAALAAVPAGAEQANINSMSFDTEGHYARST